MPESPDRPDWFSRQLIRRPAVGAVLVFGLGITFYSRLPHLPWLWIGLASILLLSAIVNRRDGGLASFSLALALCLLGLTLAQQRSVYYPPNDIALYTTEDPRLAEIEMRIEHPPRILSREFDPVRALPPRQVLVGQVSRVRLIDGWSNAAGRILVQIDPPHPSLAAGQTLRATGMLQRPGLAVNDGQFDWYHYYRNDRILASLQVRYIAGIVLVDPPSASILIHLRQQIRDSLALGFDTRHSLDHALLRALLLGDSDPELRDVQEMFRRTGTSHHLAISGLHVAVLGGFILLLTRIARIPPRLGAIVVGLFVLFYGLIALPSPPVVRSVLLCLCIGVGILHRRSIDLIQLLALSALAMLIYQPLDVFGAGFQLSFGTVLGLILFTKPIAQILDSRNPLDIPPVTPTRRQAFFQTFRIKCIQILAAALAAWLVSMPMVAFHFDRLNPWAMLGSITLAPVVFAALIFGFMKVVLTLLLPSLAGAWAVAATWPMEMMRWMVGGLEQLPAADMPLPAPSPAFIVIYYLALALPLLLIPLRDHLHPFARLIPVAVCVLLLCLPLFR